MPPSPSRDTAREHVAKLSPRVAHVAHALLFTTKEIRGPARADEIIIYDWEAPTPAQTGAALAAARREGLAEGIKGIWFATNKAHAWADALEDRSLADEDARDA